ncbi:MAG: carbamate kinase [Conexivisphaerales archaeon]
MRKRLLVIALGGNALLQRGEKGTFEEQYSNVRRTAEKIAGILDDGYMLAVTHGNGPQVGATLLRHDAGSRLYSLPAFPMDVCGAETQGFIGYMIQQALDKEFIRKGMNRKAVTVITRVLVDENDPAFANPTKPVGPFYTKEQADELSRKNPQLIFKEDSGRGYRRFVPSPDPKEILEKDQIEQLVKMGYVVISTGGGGIPVVARRSEGSVEYHGVEAVIDKDLAAERLATLLAAEKLVILTDVDAVYLNYGRQDAKALGRVRVSEMKDYIGRGYFATGSMEPKVRAAIRFVSNGGREAIIANLNRLEQALAGSSGTRVLPD